MTILFINIKQTLHDTTYNKPCGGKKNEKNKEAFFSKERENTTSY
jgi:hypothetical protein